MAHVLISDVVVPEKFTPYVQQITEEKSRIIASNMLARDASMDALLAGGGLTFNTPSWRDLANDADNVSTDADSDAVIQNIDTDTEISVRMNRNQAWGSHDLAAALVGEDPLTAIANRVGDYWARRLQAAFVATMRGVFADNAANDAGDYVHDVSAGTAGSFTAGVTDFTAEAFIDAANTMGDSMEDLTGMIVHSIVYARMQKNNLIDFIPDSEGRVTIPTFLGREVVVDDGMPSGLNALFDDGAVGEAGVYESWLFGSGAVRLGVANPLVPTEIERQATQGDGGGRESLHNRVQWSIHPSGHAYIGTPASGGPSNATTANNLGAGGSWNRVWSERKQIKIARLVTRES
jgi:hypothetical protein